MKLRSTSPCILLALGLVIGCDSTPEPGIDGGSNPGIDAGTITLSDGNVIQRDAGSDSGGPTCTWEICGDFMDQNCDGRDTSCGDTDLDGIEACRVGEAPPDCDCDDARTDVRPPFGPGVPGAPEVCDGVDNDCNGRVDEAAQCCAACMALDDPSRGDVCTTSGACDCSTEAGDGACAAGQTCCASGCVDLDTDVRNCGFCGTDCTMTRESNACVAGNCGCGTGGSCDNNCTCSAEGTCGPPCAGS